MRILVYSDLHTEIMDWAIPPEAIASADAIILAGDIGKAKKVPEWIAENCAGLPTLWVYGNHEFWGENYHYSRQKTGRSLPSDSNIHILENSKIEIGGVRFLGCTLWTDCRVLEDTMGVYSVMQIIARHMADYQKIRAGEGYRKLRLGETIGAHIESVKWLKQELSEPFDGPTVVISHHAPLPQCINPDPDPQYRALDAAYASDLSALISEFAPDVWIYGHTHQAVDCMYERTRIISNPLGYQHRLESTGFNPAFVLEI